MTVVDLNCDMGESFGAYTIGDDAAMLDVVTSANVACGFHGGDPLVMRRTLEMAKAKGVSVGAHPGFNDLWGFGRRHIAQPPEEVEQMLIYQIGAMLGIAKAVGVEVTHYKVHGALSNMAARDDALAMAVARAVKAVAPDLLFVVLPLSGLERAGAELGLPMAREIFADRGYGDDGMLVPRGEPGAMIHDAEQAADRIVGFLKDGALTSVSGKRIPVQIDTVCVHGDGPSAVAMAQSLRQQLEKGGVTVAPMARTLA